MESFVEPIKRKLFIINHGYDKIHEFAVDATITEVMNILDRDAIL